MGPSDTTFIGAVGMFGGTFTIEDYTVCNGQLLQVMQFQALYSLLGTYYGGDGRTTFAVPDLRGRTTMGYGHRPGSSSWIISQTTGNETNTLTVGQMPAHTHNATFASSGATGNLNLQASTDLGESNAPREADYLGAVAEGLAPGQSLYTADGSTTVNLSGASINNLEIDGAVDVSVTGGGTAFSIMQPTMAMNYLIALEGAYPPRQ